MSDIPSVSPVKAVIKTKRMSTYEFELYPHLWERTGYARQVKKFEWKYVFFDVRNKNKIPTSPGIYMFVVAPRHAYLRDHTYIFYVGQAVNLKTRFLNYINEQYGEELEHDRERIVDFMDHCHGHIYFNYFICDKTDLDKNEDYLVDHIYPWANTRHRKVAKAKLVSPQPI